MAVYNITMRGSQHGASTRGVLVVSLSPPSDANNENSTSNISSLPR